MPRYHRVYHNTRATDLKLLPNCSPQLVLEKRGWGPWSSNAYFRSCGVKCRLTRENAKNSRISGGPKRINLFSLFLSKTFSLGPFRNFLDHAIWDPRHEPPKVPVPQASSEQCENQILLTWLLLSCLSSLVVVKTR